MLWGGGVACNPIRWGRLVFNGVHDIAGEAGWGKFRYSANLQSKSSMNGTNIHTQNVLEHRGKIEGCMHTVL